MVHLTNPGGDEAIGLAVAEKPKRWVPATAAEVRELTGGQPGRAPVLEFSYEAQIAAEARWRHARGHASAPWYERAEVPRRPLTSLHSLQRPGGEEAEAAEIRAEGLLEAEATWQALAGADGRHACMVRPTSAPPQSMASNCA